MQEVLEKKIKRVYIIYAALQDAVYRYHTSADGRLMLLARY